MWQDRSEVKTSEPIDGSGREILDMSMSSSSDCPGDRSAYSFAAGNQSSRVKFNDLTNRHSVSEAVVRALVNGRNGPLVCRKH